MVGSIMSTGSALPTTTTTGVQAPVAEMDIKEMLAALTQQVGSLQQVLDGAGMLGDPAAAIGGGDASAVDNPQVAMLQAEVDALVGGGPVEGGGAPGTVDGPPSKTSHADLVDEAVAEGTAAGNAPQKLGGGAPGKQIDAPGKVEQATGPGKVEQATGPGKVEQATGPDKPGTGGANGGKGSGGLFDGLLGGLMNGIQGFLGNGGIESIIGAVTGALGGGGEPISSIIGGITGFLGSGGMNAVMSGISGLTSGMGGAGGSTGATSAGDSVDPSAAEDTTTAPPTAGSAGDLPTGGADFGGLPPDPTALAA